MTIKNLSCLVCLTFMLASVIQAQTAEPRDEKLWQRALQIHRRAIVIDTHNDITTAMANNYFDLGGTPPAPYRTNIERMKKGGLTAEFFSLYIRPWYVEHGGSVRRTLDMIDAVYRAVERHPRDLMFATSVADIRRAKRSRQDRVPDGHRRRTRDRRLVADVARVLPARRSLHDAHLEQHEQLG